MGWSVIELAPARQVRRFRKSSHPLWEQIRTIWRVATKRVSAVIFDSTIWSWSLLSLAALRLFAKLRGVPLSIRWGDCAWILSRQVRPQTHWVMFAVRTRILAGCQHLAVTHSHAHDLLSVHGYKSIVVGYYHSRAERIRKIAPSSEPFDPESPRLVLNVASVRERKGTDLFVSVARRVKTKCPNVRFVWLGAKPKHKQKKKGFEANIIASGADVVDFMPWGNPEEVLFSARVLLFTSRSEAGGRSVVEALAAGIPVVCFAGTGPAELVGELDEFVVQQGNLEEAVEKVINILGADPLALRDLRLRALRRYDEAFSGDEAVMRLVRAAIEAHPALA